MNTKNGRPTKSKQIEIKKKLMPYYEKGLSANFTSKETGFNIKTVCKYYKNWAEEINEKCDTDFIDHQKIIIQQGVIVMDRLVLELYDLYDVINSEIANYQKKNKQIPNHLFNMKLKCSKEIVHFLDQKFMLDSIPAIDIDLREEVRKHRRLPVTNDIRKKGYDPPKINSDAIA